jgi:hypothetical protein
VDIDWVDDGRVEITINAVRALDTAILLRGKDVDRIRLAAGESATRVYHL